ncbi:MAG: acyl-CoA thioesterase [Chitinispirillaceae bacterium]|nr:acyl-CoA thioesterase [Chitinispirillaceae bacterium]
MYDPSSKIFTLPITVEFEDIDSYRIVHNTRIIDYFERARVHFLADTIGLDLYPQGMGIVLYSIDIRFTKAARLLDTLHASVYILSMDEYRLNLGYKLLRGREALARGGGGIAFMDTGSGMLIPAPATYVAQIRPFIRETAAARLK